MTTFRAAALICVLALLPLNSASADIADIITSANLRPGTEFRIVFVTSSTTQATSSNIDTYDGVVRGLVDPALHPTLGLVKYHDQDVTWQALASAGVGAAISRLPNSNVPLFLVNGDRATLAPPAHDIWWKFTDANYGGTPVEALFHAINRTEQGTELSSDELVWTGMSCDGQSAGDGKYALGSTNSDGLAAFGISGAASVRWIYESPSANNLRLMTESHRLYGISSPITVVPEPGCLALWTMALVVGGGYGIWRRKKK